jgi:hypothetical protein
MAAIGHALVRLEHAAVGGARGLWRAVTRLAENLSDAGHGRAEWREDAEIDNPYAGRGPVRPLRDDEDRPRE